MACGAAIVLQSASDVAAKAAPKRARREYTSSLVCVGGVGVGGELGVPSVGSFSSVPFGRERATGGGVAAWSGEVTRDSDTVNCTSAQHKRRMRNVGVAPAKADSVATRSAAKLRFRQAANLNIGEVSNASNTFDLRNCESSAFGDTAVSRNLSATGALGAPSTASSSTQPFALEK